MRCQGSGVQATCEEQQSETVGTSGPGTPVGE